jgi:hypothetical protein
LPDDSLFPEEKGLVVTTHNQLISTIQAIEKDNFSMPPEHQQKAAQLFTYKDQENCKRVYQAICQL